MICTPVTFPGGARGFVCGARPRAKLCACRSGRRADLLCDWKVGGGKTCDAKICTRCSHAPAPGKDLCPEHAAAWKAWKR